VNGIWVDAFVIPPDRGSYGSFTRLAELLEQRVRDLIEAVSKTPAASRSTHKKSGTTMLRLVSSTTETLNSTLDVLVGEAIIDPHWASIDPAGAASMPVATVFDEASGRFAQSAGGAS
jgi:hypothetical protein